MLIGKNPLHLPTYTGALPAVIPVRCVCGIRYAVFTGAVVINGGWELVKALAEANGQQFVDARIEPFKMCACGQVLDFAPNNTASPIM